MRGGSSGDDGKHTGRHVSDVSFDNDNGKYNSLVPVRSANYRLDKFSPPEVRTLSGLIFEKILKAASQ